MKKRSLLALVLLLTGLSSFLAVGLAAGPALAESEKKEDPLVLGNFRL